MTSQDFQDETRQVEEFLKALTLDEKLSLLAGKNMWETMNVDRLGIPSLKTTDGPAGARGSKWTYGSLTTFVPCGISLAATFDPVLVQRVGSVLGEETRRKGCHVLLAPTMNLSRSPLGGRNFEGYGEDPYLVGVISTAVVQGIQSRGVGACMKHFIANDTETRRFNVDQTISERTLREVYMKPFAMLLDHCTPWTAMVSYPYINGHHADLSPHILKPLLRDELQYDRLVMSDWGGTNSTIESLIATTDLEMPGPAVRRKVSSLLDAVSKGDLNESKHIDPSVRRLLRLLSQVGLLPPHPTLASTPVHYQVTDSALEKGFEAEQIEIDASFHKISQEAAESGLVLLKNEGHLLPLEPENLKRVAIIGPNARKPIAGGAGSAAVNPFYITTPEDSIKGIFKARQSDAQVDYEQGIPFDLRPALLGSLLTTPDGSCQGFEVTFYAGHEFQGAEVATSHWPNSLIYLFSDGDIPASLKGKPYCYHACGLVTPQVSGRYTWSVANTGKARLFVDGQLLIDNTKWVETCGGFLGCSSEDRTAEMMLESGRTYEVRVENLVTLPQVPPFDNTVFPHVSGLRVGLVPEEDQQQMLDRAVACAQAADVAVVVVGHNKDSEGEGGDRTGIHLPGSSDALVQAVCAANPNTVVVVQAASAVAMPWVNQARAIVMAWYQGQENGKALANALVGECNFSGKTPITFPKTLGDHGSSAWFPGDAANDHSTFGEEVMVGYRHFEKNHIEPLWPFGFGLSYATFKVADISLKDTKVSDTLSISAHVKNTGDCDGHEVVQVYLSPSKCIAVKGLVSYQKTLAGFAKVFVPKGKVREVNIEISKKELRWYNEETNSWQVDQGTYDCFVGTSVVDILYETEFELV
jgi:beta-glucosidase-like glycosyl hydrolase